MSGLTPTLSPIFATNAAGAATGAGVAAAAGMSSAASSEGLATTGYTVGLPDHYVSVPDFLVQASYRKTSIADANAGVQGIVALPVAVFLASAALVMAIRRVFSPQAAVLRQFDRPPVYRPGFDWMEPGPTVGERVQSLWRSGHSRLRSLLTSWRSPQGKNATPNVRLEPPTLLDPAQIANTPAGRVFRVEGVSVRPIVPSPEGPMVDLRSPRPEDVRLGWLTYPPDAESPVIVPFEIARKAVRDRRALLFSAAGEGPWWVEPVFIRNLSDTLWPASHDVVVGLRVGRYSKEDNPDGEASVTLPWSEAWATESHMNYHPMTGVNREFVPSDWSGYTPLTLRMRHHVADTLWARLEAQWSSWSVAEKDAVSVLALAMIGGQWDTDFAQQVLRIILEGDGAARLLVRQVADAVYALHRSGVIVWTPIVPVPSDPNGTLAIEQGIVHLIMPPNLAPPSPFGTDLDPELQPDVAVTLSPWTLRAIAQIVEGVYEQLPGARGWNSLYPPAVHPDLITPAYVRHPGHERRQLPIKKAP